MHAWVWRRHVCCTHPPTQLKEINKDLLYLKEVTKRHGQHWEKALKQLKSLKTTKEQQRKEVSMSLDCFRLHLPQAKQLCKSLQRNGSNLVVERIPNEEPDFVLTVNSSILANSETVPVIEGDPKSSAVTLYRMRDAAAAVPSKQLASFAQ